MTFNSIAFAIFLPITFVAHWFGPKRWRTRVIVIASYIFYGYFDWRFLGLLILSTIVDFTVAQAIAATDEQRRRRWLLRVSIVTNLGILGLFKYFDFFTDSATDLISQVGFDPTPLTLEVLLPLGISFYTFQTVSYTIDVYRGRLEPCRDLISFSAFVAYFPQLVAGPIERAGRLLPQITADRPFPSQVRLESGVRLIVWGLVKKVVIADQVAFIADEVFAVPQRQGTAALLLGATAFMIQIYCDFSGYTDIARGTSRLFGIELVENFTQPFLSRHTTELWQRWHMSLANWMRDYVFVPQLGRPVTRVRVSRAYVVTFTLIGLWHGAAWTFVLWGTANGVLLAVERLAGVRAPRHDRFPGVRDAPWIVYFWVTQLLMLALFRSGDLSIFGQWVRGVWELRGPAPGAWWVETVAVALVATIAIQVIERRRLLSGRRLPGSARQGIVVGAATLAIVLSSGAATKPFVYFQF